MTLWHRVSGSNNFEVSYCHYLQASIVPRKDFTQKLIPSKLQETNKLPLSTWDDTGHDVYGSAAHSYKAPSTLHPETMFLSGAAQGAVPQQWHSHDQVSTAVPYRLTGMLPTGTLKCGGQFGKWGQCSVLGSAPAPNYTRTRTECTLRLQTDSS